MIGPSFYAVKVATRGDNVTVYLGSTMTRAGYKCERLGEAARFMNAEAAEEHLYNSREIGPEVVELRSVIRQQGDWRAWHATRMEDALVLNGPDGETVTLPDEGPASPRAARFPWSAAWPDGSPLLNDKGHARMFMTALAARQAIERAMRDEHQRHVDEANRRSQSMRG
jgi:hypothetical protein